MKMNRESLPWVCWDLNGSLRSGVARTPDEGPVRAVRDSSARLSRLKRNRGYYRHVPRPVKHFPHPAVAAEAPKHDFTARFFGYPDRSKFGLQGFYRRSRAPRLGARRPRPSGRAVPEHLDSRLRGNDEGRRDARVLPGRAVPTGRALTGHAVPGGAAMLTTAPPP